jgi:hypothetical protein
MSDPLGEPTGTTDSVVDQGTSGTASATDQGTSATGSESSETVDPTSSGPTSAQTTETVTTSAQKTEAEAPAQPPPPSEGKPATATSGDGEGQSSDPVGAVSTTSKEASESVQANAGQSSGAGGQALDTARPSDTGGTGAAGSTDPLTESAPGTTQPFHPLNESADATLGATSSVTPPMETTLPEGAGTSSVAGAADPLTRATHDVGSGIDPTVGSSADNFAGAPGGLEPVLQPLSFEAPANAFELPPTLGGAQVAVAAVPDASLPPPLTPPDGPLALKDELGGTTGTLTDTAGGLTQQLAQAPDPLGQTLSDTLGAGTALPDASLPPPLTPPDGPLALKDELGGTTGTLTDTAAHTFGTGDSHEIGESTRSLLDAVANGLSSTGAVYGRAAALVLLLGLMAMRLSSAMTVATAYATAGIGESMRTGWLTSWGSVRCFAVNASRLVSAPLPSVARIGGGALGGVFQPPGQGALGEVAGLRPPNPFRGYPGPRAIVDGGTGRSARQFLAALLLAGASLLAAARLLERRGLLQWVRLCIAVIGASILLAVGLVLALAP